MIDKLQRFGIKVRLGSRGDVKTVCPKCSTDRKHKSDPCLSVNVDEGVWNCHHCGWSGSVGKERKEYSVPRSELKNLSDPVIKYFEKRGISNQTLLRYRVTESKEYFGDGEVNAINFNYFLNNELVNIKYRDAQKRFKLVSGAMLSLYGIDVACDNSDKEIIITEGEPDAMSYYEAGIKIAVSVPNGASKGNQKLEWLEEMLPYLTGKRVFLSTDNDEAGISLRNELARRLGKENCWIIHLPEKDANDTLVKHGPDALAECFHSASPFPIDGIDSVSEDDLLNLYDAGMPEGYDLGWDNMDESYVHQLGMVTLVTGIPGHGKTTWLKNVIVRLAERHDWSFLIYSAEEANATMAMTDLLTIKTGKTFFNANSVPRISREEIVYNKPFLDQHFKYYKLDENDSTVDAIIAMLRVMVTRYGIKGLVIDNMSTIERQFGGKESRHEQIGNMLRDLVGAARLLGVHIWLVAHPKKMSRINGSIEVPTGYDVGDSSHYFNAPDNGLTVYRNHATGQTEIHRWKVRFKHSGQIGTDYFTFDLPTSRYRQANKLNDGTNKTKFIGQPDIEGFVKAGGL